MNIEKNMMKRSVLSYLRQWCCVGVLACTMDLTYANGDAEFAGEDIFGSDVIPMDAVNTQEEKKPFTLRTISPNVLAIGLSQIEEPIWNFTKAPAGRDILYLLPYKITAIEYGGFVLNFFFNMTSDMRVTANNLLSLDGTVNNPRFNFNTFMEYFLPDQKISDQELQQLIPLFQKLIIQERKAGLLFQGGVTKGPFSFQLHTSLQIAARNFWMSQRDQDSVKAVLKNTYDSSMNEREFYKIRGGLGDTRLKIGLNTVNMTSFQTDVGIETILPTSRFSGPQKLYLGMPQAVFELDKFKDEALNALRATRDHMVGPRLGNGGHFGFGCYIESKFGLFHELIQLWSRISYDVLLSNEEDRLFMFRQVLTPNSLDAVGPANPPTPQDQKLLNDYIRQYIFPSAFKTTVSPGGILNFVLAANVDFTKRIRWALGYDFYAQQEETIKELHNTDINMQDLRVEDAQLPSVYQHKIFTELLYHNKKPSKDLGIGIGGDLTIASRHIGEDWTLYVKFTSSF